MKRDMDLIREILLEIEEKGSVKQDYNNDVYNEHVQLLAENNYINTNINPRPATMGRGAFLIVGPGARQLQKGHDFLASIKHDNVFQAVKVHIQDNGFESISIEMFEELANGLMRKTLGLE